MIQTSQEFKNAVRDGKPQRAWLRFDGVLFTNEDIDLTAGGIIFTERFNESTDLQIGAAPSSSLNAQLFNDNGLLNDYEFGKLEASLGALTSTSKYSLSGNVMSSYGGGLRVFTGHNTRPYLRENGSACSMQPSFPVKSILVEDNIVYCFGDGPNDYYAFSVGDNTWGGVSRFTWDYMASYKWDNLPKDYIELTSSARSGYGNVGKFELNPFMRKKMHRWASEHRGISKQGDTLREYYPDGTVETYEMVKLGTFVAPRPSIVRKRVIDMESNDQMVLFDEMWFDDIGINFPITIDNLLERICAEAGVECITKSFIGDGTLLKEKPDAFDNATLREIVAWIAEAACSYARFNRDGKLELTWFNQTNRTFNEHDYSDFTPISYDVKRVDKLHIRNADSMAELVLGSGDNAYLIQDNPLLREDDSDIIQAQYGSESNSEFVSDQKISTIAARDDPSIPIAFATYAADGRIENTTSPKSIIYDKLASFPEFSPSSASLFSDWSTQAGDIVTVSSDGESFSVPIYSSTLYWNGGAKYDIESTGNETREPLSKFERQLFGAGRAGYGSKNALEGLRRWAEINIDELNARITLSAGEIDELKGRVSQAEIDIDGINARILLWAQRTEENEQRISQAFIDIDGANARITLNASRLDNIDGRLSQAEIDINGAEGSIGLKAIVANLNDDLSNLGRDYETLSALVDEVGERVSAAEINIDGANALITEWAGRTELLEVEEGLLQKRISDAELSIDGANADIKLLAKRTQVLSDGQDALTTRMTKAEIDIDGALADIKLKADQSIVTALTERVSSAEIDINGAKADIKLKADASTVDSLTKRVSSAEIDINGLQSSIRLKADSSTVSSLSSRLSSAEISINGMKGEITLKASQTDMDNVLNSEVALWNWVEAAGNTFAQRNNIISYINISPESITISSSKVNLIGYVTASELSAEKARFNNLTSGATTANQLRASSIISTNVSATSLLSVAGNLASWKTATIAGTTIHYLGR